MNVRSVLRSVATLMSILAAPGLGQGDPLQDRLDEAVAVYNDSVEQETESLADYINDKITAAMSRGDLDLKKSFEATNESLQKGEMPTLQLLKSVIDRAKRDHARAKNKLHSEYLDVEKDYVKQGNDKRAEAVRRESEQLDAQLADHVVARTQRPKPKTVIPADAVKWPTTGHHYKFYATPGSLSWSDAQQRCRDVGGYLACGETPEEFEFLYSLRAGKRSWLGGREMDGRWVWTTGIPSPVPAGKGGSNKFLATTRGDTVGRIAQPDSAGVPRAVFGCDSGKESAPTPPPTSPPTLPPASGHSRPVS